MCVCVCVYTCSPCYYCVGRRRRNTCFRSRISICGLSLLFKAPPIGFCNHHIFFFCYLFLPSFVCRRGGGSAGGTGCCCRPPGWLLLQVGGSYIHTSTRRVVCVSGGLKTRDDRESLEFFERNIPAAIQITDSFSFFLPPESRQWCAEEGHQKTQSTARIGVNQRKVSAVCQPYWISWWLLIHTFRAWLSLYMCLCAVSSLKTKQ